MTAKHDLADDAHKDDGGVLEFQDIDKLKGLQAGETTSGGRWGQASVVNSTGRASCSIQLNATWDVPPDVVFAIFTHPGACGWIVGTWFGKTDQSCRMARSVWLRTCLADNSQLFRDIKRIGSRAVLTSSPGYREVEASSVLYCFGGGVPVSQVCLLCAHTMQAPVR
jgi:hypothetical protein